MTTRLDRADPTDLPNVATEMLPPKQPKINDSRDDQGMHPWLWMLLVFGPAAVLMWILEHFFPHK